MNTLLEIAVYRGMGPALDCAGTPMEAPEMSAIDRLATDQTVIDSTVTDRTTDWELWSMFESGLMSELWSMSESGPRLGLGLTAAQHQV